VVLRVMWITIQLDLTAAFVTIVEITWYACESQSEASESQLKLG